MTTLKRSTGETGRKNPGQASAPKTKGRTASGKTFTRGPRLLHTHRYCMSLLERARLRVDAGRVVYDVAEDAVSRCYNLPHVNVSVLLLGQGCSITTEAARKLGEENVIVGMTGTGGSPFFLGSMEAYQQTGDLRRWVPIAFDDRRRLQAAITMQDLRARLLPETLGKVHRIEPSCFVPHCDAFRAAIQRARSTEELLGHEGAFTRRIYAEFARLHGIAFTRHQAVRQTDAGKELSDDRLMAVNAAIDHGNYLAYGIAAVCLWTLGVPPSLSAFHGKTRAGGLIFDLADVFKDSFVLPVAFRTGAALKPGERFDESGFRAALIDAFDDGKAMELAFSTFRSVLDTQSEPGRPAVVNREDR